MDCDLLLSWMSQAEDGSWSSFRNSVEELAGADDDLNDLSRSLRISLSDLGFTDFFVDESQQWRMLPPRLGGLAGKVDVATYIGSRTPALVHALEASSANHGCRIQKTTPVNCPTLIRIEGSSDSVSAIADEVGVSFVSNLSENIAPSLTPIPVSLERASTEPAPLNWQVRSFDCTTSTWLDGLLPDAACEFIPSYGHKKHFVHRKRGKLLKLSKRETHYAAAMLHGIQLARYEAETRNLTVPLFAPLPELYSRMACLCSGEPAQIVDGRIVYAEVPPDLAAVLIVALGQSHPAIAHPTGIRRRADG